MQKKKKNKKRGNFFNNRRKNTLMESNLQSVHLQSGLLQIVLSEDEMILPERANFY